MGHEGLVRALVNLDVFTEDLEEPSDEHRSQLQRAHEESDLAKHELESGFPLLIAHSLLGLWGAFEALVENLMVAWLTNVPESLTRDDLMGIKIDLAMYEAMDAEERLRLIAQTVQRGDVGIGRFEAGFAAIGLGGGLPHTSRRALVEMEAVRHVWAHRAGIADDRFRDRCPWHPTKAGERVLVSQAQFAQYTTECVTYTLRLLKRCADRLGVRFGHTIPGDEPTEDAV